MLTLREALQNAATSHMALGHFNVSDLSGFHAVVRAGRRLNLPLMIGVSEGEREFIGLKEIALLVRIAREEYGVSLYLNADHTHSLEKARAAAEAGFDEVIFDASVKSFEQNIHETRQAVEILKSIRPDLIVEGEVGYIGASSEIVESVPVESLKLTTPQEAAQFVAETKVDVLAPAVGNMHGLLASMVRGVSGVNYFFGLTTIISPYQRQLLFYSFRGRGAPVFGQRAEPFWPAAPRLSRRSLSSAIGKMFWAGRAGKADHHTFFFS